MPIEARGALPVIPPPHVRFPDGFDAEGCALIARGGPDPQRVCPVTRTPPQPSSGGTDWSRYLGYEGPPPDAGVHGGGVVVLPHTLVVASSGWWRATGLVRNDAPHCVHEVRVTVTFATADDRPLGSTTTLVPVRDVRPGEPAPFELRTLVPAESVRHVHWRVTTADDEAAPSSRMAEIEVGRIAPSPMVQSRRVLALLATGATDAEPIGWGILRNWGPAPIAHAKVVGMWLDEQGRAVRMVDARIRPGTRSPGAANGELLPGGTVQFDLFERSQGVPRPRGWRLALWQTTS